MATEFTPSDSAAIRRRVEALCPWFHNLHLPDGSQTAPDHFLGDFPAYKWEELATVLPTDLSDAEVLDVGCNAGYYSLELARRGARVTALDMNRHYLAQANWAAELFGLGDRIQFVRGQVYDLAHDERQFDLVLFLGVFYHLRYPLLGLDIVARKSRDLLAFQTLTMPGEPTDQVQEDLPIDERAALTAPGWPRMAFIEHRLANDPTNWWAADPAAVEAMLRSTGLRVIERPGTELYLCRIDPDAPRLWDAAELLAATGRSPDRGQAPL